MVNNTPEEPQTNVRGMAENYDPDGVIYLAPSGINTDSEFDLEIIETGSISHRIAAAETMVRSSILVVTDDELNLITTNLRFFEFEPVIMMNIPDADYTNNWHLAAVLVDTEDYNVYMANKRDAESKTHTDYKPKKLEVTNRVNEDVEDAVSAVQEDG